MGHSESEEAAFFEAEEFEDVIVESEEGKGDEGEEDDLDFGVDVEVWGYVDIAEF